MIHILLSVDAEGQNKVVYEIQEKLPLVHQEIRYKGECYPEYINSQQSLCETIRMYKAKRLLFPYPRKKLR